MRPSILHLDIDAFFASVEQLKNPRLRGKPVVVGNGVIASCSYEARRYGLRAGMPLRQAQRLCPHAAFLDGNQHTYSCFAEAVWEICRRWLPRGDLPRRRLRRPHGDRRSSATPRRRPRAEARGPREDRPQGHGRRRRQPHGRPPRRQVGQARRPRLRGVGGGGRVPRRPPRRRPPRRRPRHGRPPARDEHPPDPRPPRPLARGQRRHAREERPAPLRALPRARHPAHPRAGDPPHDLARDRPPPPDTDEAEVRAFLQYLAGARCGPSGGSTS